MRVVGLDVASSTGVCLGEPGQAPQFWTEDLRGGGKTHDARFASALRLTKRLISDHNVEAIGIEAPLIVPKRDKKANNELLMGLVACIRGWAAIKGVRCETFEIRTIDRHFLGSVQTEGRDARKAAIWNRCKMLGWEPQTQDEADAGSVYEVMCSRMSPAYAASSGLLLSRRVG